MAETRLLVSALRKRIRDSIQPLVPQRFECAVVDFPDHPNVGDSAIWAGELAWLADVRAEIRYRCDVKTYNRWQLDRALGPGGIIFIHGGGNLGDLWVRHQRLRERVIQDFPDRTIIQFPQTIHFRDREAIARTRAVFDAHPDLTLLVRDEPSLQFARAEFRARTLLCPDMAFYIGSMPRPGPPRVDVLWLQRQDRESAEGQGAALEPGWATCDWLSGDFTVQPRIRRLLWRVAAHEPRRLHLTARLIGGTYDWQARQRVLFGCRLLTRGRVVITDRLHGHILCLLLNVPHVLLDNNYGKVRHFREAWTVSAANVRWAGSGREAVAAAQDAAPVTMCLKRFLRSHAPTAPAHR